MKKINKKEKIKKDMEKYYTTIYAEKTMNLKPTYIETIVHPDCMFKYQNKLYAIEATGYFYQQETDYSNRLYKKVLKYINSANFIEKIYACLGRKPLLNIIDAIYYDNVHDIMDDILKGSLYIEEIEINKNHFYNNETLLYNATIDGLLKKMSLEEFLSALSTKDQDLRFAITLKQKYSVPMKMILIHNKNIIYNNKRTLIPIVSFEYNNTYNFKSLRSLIENKEYKLKNIYKEEMKRQKIHYDKFILLIHPIDYPIDIYPELIFNELKDLFKKSKFDNIVIILKDSVMVTYNSYYKIY